MKGLFRLAALVGALALGLATITVQTAQADPGSLSSADTVSEVRLITGDAVGLDADGEVTRITPAPRPDGSIPQFSISTSENQTYVIPDDVEALVPDQLDRELFNVTELTSYGLDDTVPVIVMTNDTAPVQEAANDVSQLGVEVTDSLDTLSTQVGLADASTDQGPAPAWDLLQQLAASPTSSSDAVSSDSKVWLDRQIHMDAFTPLAAATLPDPVWMNLIGKDAANAEGYTGTGVKVAVVDSGIDTNHPDLAGQVVAQQDFTGTGLGDGYGHGTFVASEIAGTGAALAGKYAGVAPDAKLVIARVLDSDGESSDSIIMAGMEWAAQQRPSIVNMSIGYQYYYDDGTSKYSEFLNKLSREYDCLFVVAAGNDGTAQTVSSPATADEALTVAATYQDGTFATRMSSYGPRRGDGAVKPEILAPGAISPTGGGLVGAQANTSTYLQASGTSMAAPLVSGAAALLVQEDPTLSHDQLRAKLMASATLEDMSIFQQGAGLLNIPAALSQSVTTTPTQLDLGTAAFPTATLTYVNSGTAPQTYELTTTGIASATKKNDAVTVQPMWIPDPASDDPITISASSVTVPAGGTASVQVSLNPAKFTADYIGGYVTATSSSGAQIQTPIGWANLSQPLTVAITTDTTTAVMGAPITATAAVTGTDDVPIANAPVTFTAPDGVTVTGDDGTTTCVTGEDGTCTVTITSSVAGTYTDAITAGINGVVADVIGSPATLTFTPEVTVTLTSWSLTLTMDSPMGYPSNIVYAQDANGEPVDGLTVTFTVEGDSVALVDTSCVTGVGPIFNFDVVQQPQPGACSATFMPVQPGQSIIHGFYNGVEIKNSPRTITVYPGPDQTSQLQVTRTGVPADGTSTAILTAWAYDDMGQLEKGATVRFSTDDPAAQLSSQTCTTLEDGSCTVMVTSTVASGVVVHAYEGRTELLYSPAGIIFDPQVACPQLRNNPVVSCEASAYNVYSVDGIGQSNNLTTPAGTSVMVGVYLVQPLNNGSPWIAGTTAHLDGVEVTYVIDGDAETTSNTCVTTNGMCEIVLTSNTPGTVTVRGYIGDWELGDTPATITFTKTSEPSGDWFSVTPSSRDSVEADGVSSWTGTLTLSDATGQPITTAASHDIGFILPAGVSASEVTNNGDGTYTVSFTSTTPGEYDITAYAALTSADGLVHWPLANAHATITFDPVPPPEQDPSQSEVAASVTLVNVHYPACGGDPDIDPESMTVTALVRDITGAPMNGVMVDFAAGSWLKVTGDSSVRTTADGYATTTVAVDPAVGENAVINAVVHASVNGVEIGQASISLVVTQSQPPEWVPGMVVTPTSTPVWADGQSSYTATVTAIDGCGVPVTGTEIRFSVTGAAHLSVETGLTDENGVITTTVTDTSIEQASLSAVAMIGGQSTTVGGSPVNLAFDDPQGPPAPTVRTANAAQISGSAKAGTTVVVTYPTDEGTNTAEADVTSVGAWTLATPDDAIDGPLVVQARDSFGRLSASTNAHIDVTAPGAPIVLVANDSEISGTSEADAWIQVVDADGNPLGNVTADGDGVWLVPTPNFAVPGEISVTATDAAGNVSSPRTALLSIVPNSEPDPARSSLTVSEAQITITPGPCGGASPESVTATATINDSEGRPLPGVMVDFTVDAPLVISGASNAETGPDGVAQVEVGVDPEVNLTMDGNTAYVRVAVAGVDMGSPAPVSLMLAGPVMNPQVVVSSAQLDMSSAVPVWANGTAAWTATVSVIDQCDAPVAGVEVEFSVLGNASLSASSIATDSEGKATTLVTSTVPGEVRLSATATWLDEPVVVAHSPVDIQFSTQPVTPTPDPGQTTASLSSQDVNIGLQPCGAAPIVDPSSVTLEVVVRDTMGAVLPGAQVDFAADSPIVVPAHAVADEEGVVRVELGADPTGMTSLNPQIHVSLDGVEISNSPLSIALHISTPSLLPGHFAVNAVPAAGTTPVWADGASAWTIEVQALDMCDVGKGLTGVNFAVTGDAQLSQAAAITDEQGRASVQVSDASTETVTVTVSSDFMDSASTSIEFTAQSPVPAPIVTKANASGITGTAPAGTIVELTYPTASEPMTVNIPVDEGGAWSLTSFNPVSGEVSLFTVEADGRQSTPVTFTLDADAPAQATIDVSCGNQISGSVGSPVDAGTTVSIVWPGSSTTAVVTTGTWSVPVPSGTPAGAFQVVVSDPAGNQSVKDGTYQTTCPSPTASTTSPTASTSPSSSTTSPSSATTSPTSTPTTASPSSTASSSTSPTSTTSSPTASTPTSSATASSPTATSSTSPANPTSTSGGPTSVTTKPTASISATSNPTASTSATASPSSVTSKPTVSTSATATSIATSTSSTSPANPTSTSGNPTSVTTKPTSSTSAPSGPTSAPTSASQTPTAKPSTSTSGPTSSQTSTTSASASVTSSTSTSASTTTSASTSASVTASATTSASATMSASATASASSSSTLAPTSTSTSPTSASSTSASPTSTSASSPTSNPTSVTSRPTSSTSVPSSPTSTTSVTSIPVNSTSTTSNPISSTSTTSTQGPTSVPTTPTSVPTQTSVPTSPSAQTSSPTQTSSAPTPSISASPTSSGGPTSTSSPTVEIRIGHAGPDYTFYGLGFVPGESVTAQISSDAVNLSPQTADSTGMVTFLWTAPADFQPGTHQIAMTAASGTITQTFTISTGASASTVPVANAGSGVVAPTGGTTAYLPILPIAVFLLVGTGLAGLLRRTSKNSQ